MLHDDDFDYNDDDIDVSDDDDCFGGGNLKVRIHVFSELEDFNCKG